MSTYADQVFINLLDAQASRFIMEHFTRARQTTSHLADTTYDIITQGRQEVLADFQRFEAARTQHRRQGASRQSHTLRDRLTHRRLVETRQARAMAGLDTSELDVEITRRVLNEPRLWGQIGTELAVRGWVDDMEIARRLSSVERLRYPRYVWTQQSGR
jgi:hypothetical protein